jgi:hypothetical protein
MKNKNFYIELDEQTFKKLNKFAIPKGIVKNDVIRTLIDKSNIKIDVQKYKSIKKNKNNKEKEYTTKIVMPDELRKKLNNMRLHNNITCNEIVNQLVMQADLNSMRFRIKGENQKFIAMAIDLDVTTNRKIKEFALVHGLYVSQVIRALIQKSSMKIKDVRNKVDIINHSKQEGKVDVTNITPILSKKLLVKLRKMSLQNKTSCSEIIRNLIDRTDLESLKIKSKIKIMPIWKIRMGMYLDDMTNNKIRDFSKMNDVSLAEIVRVLIDNSDMKFNARNYGTIVKHGKEKQVNKRMTLISLTQELFDKIDEAKSRYHTTYSEIIRILIREADLNSISFMTRAEMGYGRINKRNR